MNHHCVLAVLGLFNLNLGNKQAEVDTYITNQRIPKGHSMNQLAHRYEARKRGKCRKCINLALHRHLTVINSRSLWSTWSDISAYTNIKYWQINSEKLAQARGGVDTVDLDWFRCDNIVLLGDINVLCAM